MKTDRNQAPAADNPTDTYRKPTETKKVTRTSSASGSNRNSRISPAALAGDGQVVLEGRALVVGQQVQREEMLVRFDRAVDPVLVEEVLGLALEREDVDLQAH